MPGGLDLYLVPDVSSQYEKGLGIHYLGIVFETLEWDALFFDVLPCPLAEPFRQGEDIDEYNARRQLRFRQAIPEYPMLGRIWDMYEDVFYQPEEVDLLRRECLRIQSMTQNSGALEGLRKLIFGCDEALKCGAALYLASD